MAKLYFYYGAMNSSKSMNLLMAAHNYESQGKEVLVLANSIDDRHGLGKITSRVGLSRDSDYHVYPTTNIYKKVKEHKTKLYAVLVDEIQFFKSEQIEELAQVADELNIPVLGYGLITDFRGMLFNGSERMIELADKISEVKTICTFCERKATHNLRTNNKRPVYEGDTIQVGDEEYYPVCRKHHKNPAVNNRGKIQIKESVLND